MKNKNRLTVEEVNESMPSFYNPLEVECDDGWFTNNLKVVKIIAPMINSFCACLDSHNNLIGIYSNDLNHYPSQKPEREKFYKWKYLSDGSMGTTTDYYNNEFRNTNNWSYYRLKNASFKEICTEFRPIYSDGSYADE